MIEPDDLTEKAEEYVIREMAYAFGFTATLAELP